MATTTVLAPKRGVACVLTIDGTTIDLIVDLTWDRSTSEIDTTCRRNAGWETSMAGLKKWKADGSILYDTADGQIQIIENAWLNRTEVTAVFSGTLAMTCKAYIVSCKESQPSKDAVKLDISISGSQKPTVGYGA